MGEIDMIRGLLKDKKIDRRELAMAIGVSPSYLGNILNGWANLKEETRAAILFYVKSARKK